MRIRILLALLIVSTAQASDWVSLGKGHNGNLEMFADVSNIRATGPVKRAWVKAVYAPFTSRGAGQRASKWESESLELIAFNCQEQVERMEAITTYYTDGTLYTVSASSFPLAWEAAVPDTVMASEMDFICLWKANAG